MMVCTICFTHSIHIYILEGLPVRTAPESGSVERLEVLRLEVLRVNEHELDAAFVQVLVVVENLALKNLALRDVPGVLVVPLAGVHNRSQSTAEVVQRFETSSTLIDSKYGMHNVLIPMRLTQKLFVRTSRARGRTLHYAALVLFPFTNKGVRAARLWLSKKYTCTSWRRTHCSSGRCWVGCSKCAHNCHAFAQNLRLPV